MIRNARMTYDPDHGLRAAEFAELLNGVAFEIESHELKLLTDPGCGFFRSSTKGIKIALMRKRML